MNKWSSLFMEHFPKCRSPRASRGSGSNKQVVKSSAVVNVHGENVCNLRLLEVFKTSHYAGPRIFDEYILWTSISSSVCFTTSMQRGPTALKLIFKLYPHNQTKEDPSCFKQQMEEYIKNSVSFQYHFRHLWDDEKYEPCFISQHQWRKSLSQISAGF